MRHQRGDQDRFSAQSHKRAAAAWEAGAFAAEVVPVTVGSGAKARTVSRDEGIRPDSTPEGLAKLRPAFRAGRDRDGGQRLATQRWRSGRRARIGPSGRTTEREAAGSRRRLCDQRRGAERIFLRPGAGRAHGTGESRAAPWGTSACSN